MRALNDYIKREKVFDRCLALILSLLMVLSSLGEFPVVAHAESEEAFCGLEEHVHTDKCYDKALICGQEESEGHEHTETCYEQQPVLACGLQEVEAHHHSDECYAEEKELICEEEHEHTDDCYKTVQKVVCGLGETDGHTHSDTCYEMQSVLACGKEEVEEHSHKKACYEKKLTCEKAEHEHELSCYSDPSADVENKDDWAKSAAIFVTGNWSRDLAAVANTQLGYSESEKNYAVVDGEIHGYTRYGAWANDAYADWNALFVSFCLHFARVPASAMPTAKDAKTWLKAIDDAGKLASVDYVPKRGDLVFLRDSEEEMNASRVGVVASASDSSIAVIEGRDAVVKNNYKLSSAKIVGFAIMPENDAYTAPTFVEEVPATCTENGTKAHYVTSDGKYMFEDEDCFRRLSPALITIPASHSFGETSYIWSKDYSVLTAKRVCSICEEVEEETVDVSAKVTKEATETEKGETTYTSGEFKNDAFAVQIIVVDNIPMIEPKETVEPTVVPTVAPSEKPAETAAPIETEAPSETQSPAITEKPAETQAPVATETPKPVETETPIETETPAASEDPAEEMFMTGENALKAKLSKKTYATVHFDENAQIPLGSHLVMSEEETTDGIQSAIAAASVSKKGAKKSGAGIDANGMNVALVRSFDVKIVNADGHTVQPKSGSTVSLDFVLPEVTNKNLDVSVYHMSETKTGLTAEKLSVIRREGNSLTVETSGFSTFTIKFTYSQKEFVLNSRQPVLVTDLLSALGMVGTATSAQSSNSDVLAVETDEGGQMAVRAKARFTSGETLRVTIDGVDFDISVTGFSAIARVSNDGENWTYHDVLIGDGNKQDYMRDDAGNPIGASRVSMKAGAFNQANAMSGDVVIELLCEGYDGSEDDTNGGYTLASTFTFNGSGLKSVRLGTTQSENWNGAEESDRFVATLHRGYNGNSLFTINKSGLLFVTQNIIVDGAKTAQMSGRAIEVANSGASLIVKGGSAFRNLSAVGANEGGAIFSQANIEIQVGNGEEVIFSNCKSTSEAGAVSLNGRKLTIKNAGTLRVENCSGTYAGALCTDTTGEMTITNSGVISFAGCTATPYGGGAIWTGIFKAENNSGSISFTNCKAKSDGGAIIANRGAASSDTFVLTNTATGTASFVNCASDSTGGAIRVSSGNATITSQNASRPITFENCTAGNGGAIYQGGGMAMALENITFGADGEADKSCTGSSGGAVYTAARGTVNLRNVKAYGKGSGTPTASTSGGAILVESAALTVNDGEFKDLAATNSGGAIYAGGAVSITGTENVNFTNCTAGVSGGAICQNGGASMTLENIAFGEDGNAAKACTGANGGAVFSNASKTVDLTNVKVYGKGRGDDMTASGNGGAIDVEKAALTVNNGVFKDLMAGDNGGAIFAAGNVDVDVSDTVFVNCVAAGNETTLKHGGGAIYQNSGNTMNLTNVTFGEPGAADKGCMEIGQTGAGGAVYTAASVATMTDCSFYYCEATGTKSNGGGAIFYNKTGGSLSIYGCVFDHCVASSTYDLQGIGNAGAVYFASGNALCVDKSSARRSSFTNCTATRYGGAIEYEPNNTGTLVVKNADFARCVSATKQGGAIGTDSVTALIENCTFADCTAAMEGGAIMGGMDATAPVLTLINSTINACRARSGAAVYSAGDLTIKQSGSGESEFSGCVATANGGGAVNVSSGKKIFFEGNVVISDNTRGGNKANVVLDQDNKTTINALNLGIGPNANIGIYVTGITNPEAEPYRSRGGVNDAFGTNYGSEEAAMNLSNFHNDRNGLSGAKGVNENDIVWKSVVLVHEGEMFRDFENMANAKISKDSAYTIRCDFGTENPLLTFFDINGENVTIPVGTSVIMVTDDGDYYYYIFTSSAISVPVDRFKAMGSDTGFSVSKDVTANFIMNFADAQSTLASLPDGTLNVGVYNSFGDGSSASVILTDTAGFEISRDGALDVRQDDLLAAVNVSTNAGTRVNDGRATKWDARDMSLVLTEVAEEGVDRLPADAALLVKTADNVASVVYHINEAGQYIVPLGSFGQYNGIRIELYSKMFPRTRSTYKLKAALVAADSLREQSPLNGSYNSNNQPSVDLVFGINNVRTSVKISSNRRSYEPGETVLFEVNSLNSVQDTISAVVYKKTGEDWTSQSAMTEELTVKASGVADGTFTNISFVIPEGEDIESYKIFVTAKDDAGNTVASAPYYFLCVKTR